MVDKCDQLSHLHCKLILDCKCLQMRGLYVLILDTLGTQTEQVTKRRIL